MTTPLLTPPDAKPPADNDDATMTTESLSRPFRLGLIGVGAAIGLSVRLLAANGFGELNTRPVILGVALTSTVMGLGLLFMAAERDRFDPPLAWISAVTSLAWGALNWISPPFAESVTVWSKPDQAVLAALGAANGLMLAGIVALAFVRRRPTMTVAAVIVGSVFALAANTVVLRDQWPAIASLGIAFALILFAWDRSPRRELAFNRPDEASRVSRAALGFISVALCGTAIQLWTSRTDIPRAAPAVITCVVLIIAAFASLIRVRREIEQRETTLSEWTSWAREIRTNDFRAEIQNFESDRSPSISFDTRTAGADGEAPRKLSFPNLMIPDTGEMAIESIGADELAAAAADPGVAPTEAESIIADTSESAHDVSLPAQATAPGLGLVADTGHVYASGVDSVPVEPDPRGAISTAELVAAPPALPRVEPVVSEPQSAKPPTTPSSTAPVPAQASGVFSTMLANKDSEPANAVEIANLDALETWLSSPAAAARITPLLIAVEAMSLDEFESLPPADRAVATGEIGSFLADTVPDADLVSWIDGPYFIIALASKPDRNLIDTNKAVLKSLKSSDGTLAFLRPRLNALLDDTVNECVMALFRARQTKERATGH